MLFDSALYIWFFLIVFVGYWTLLRQARARVFWWPLQLRGHALHAPHADTLHARGTAQSSVTHLSHRRGNT